MKRNSDTKIKSDIVLNTVQQTDSLEPILTQEQTRQMVYDGCLSLQYSLFKHAKGQQPRLDRLSNLIENIEGIVFTEDILKQLDKQQLIKLYSIANNQINESIGFLERLHKLVQDTEDVSKVTNTLNISVNSILNSDESIQYRSKGIDNERLRNVKEMLVRNIIGNAIDTDVIDIETIEAIEKENLKE